MNNWARELPDEPNFTFDVNAEPNNITMISGGTEMLRVAEDARRNGKQTRKARPECERSTARRDAAKIAGANRRALRLAGTRALSRDSLLHVRPQLDLQPQVSAQNPVGAGEG